MFQKRDVAIPLDGNPSGQMPEMGRPITPDNSRPLGPEVGSPSRFGDAKSLLRGIRLGDSRSPGTDTVLNPLQQQDLATEIVLKRMSPEERQAYSREKAEYDAKMTKYLSDCRNTSNHDFTLMVRSRSSEAVDSAPTMGPTMKRVNEQARALTSQVGDEVKASMSQDDRDAMAREEKAVQDYYKDVSRVMVGGLKRAPETPVTDRFSKAVGDRLLAMSGGKADVTIQPAYPTEPQLVEIRDLLRQLMPLVDRLSQRIQFPTEPMPVEPHAFGRSFATLVQQLSQERASPLPISMRPSTGTTVELAQTLARLGRGPKANDEGIVLQA